MFEHIEISIIELTSIKASYDLTMQCKVCNDSQAYFMQHLRGDRAVINEIVGKFLRKHIICPQVDHFTEALLAQAQIESARDQAAQCSSPS